MRYKVYFPFSGETSRDSFRKSVRLIDILMNLSQKARFVIGLMIGMLHVKVLLTVDCARQLSIIIF